MKTLTIPAYAKINLFLEIREKREDGYHAIESVMQSVSLSDTLTLTLSEEKGIRLLCEDAAIPSDEKNTAVMAAMRFFERFPSKYGLDITLKKAIPHQAGLGGGSADAAAVLRGLDALLHTDLTADELIDLAAKVGSDVPFCLFGGTSIAKGRGEILSDAPALAPCTVLIAKDTQGMSTPEAYRLADDRPKETLRSLEPFCDALKEGSLSAVCGKLYNGFESVVFPLRKSAAELKSFFLSNGADGALMSGSGTSVFALYAREKEADKAASLLEKQGISCFKCRPIHPSKSL